MRVVPLIFLALTFTACAAQPPAAVTQAPPMDAPSTSMIASTQRPILAAQVLTGDDAEWYAARAEKTVFGAQPVAAVTFYSIDTYDVQRISSIWGGSGYRTRWIVQSGYSVPLAP